MHPLETHILVLGSGTAQPSVDRASPAFILRCRGETTLIDLGPGTLRQLARAGIHHSAVDQILVSHFHPDHTADLIHFLFATRHPPVLAARTPFRIAGPVGLSSLLDALKQAYGRWIDIPGDILSVLEWPLAEAGPRALGALTVRARRMPHTEQSLAYRIETPGGRTVVYSGDTGPSDELIDLAKKCDLLILECSFPEERGVENHLSPKQAGEVASAAEPGKLLLVHFYPEVLAVDIAARCRKAYGGELVLARDLMAVRV
ncbi:MAG: ribonuclease Z [Deltaproteobacteria bacterium]|nr:ribonuclease Z [Deltaproteobacteria bacterium]